MAILIHYINNFAALSRAYEDGNVALLECTDIATQKRVVALCAVEKHNGEYVMKPFAKMFDGNPYAELVPPRIEELES